MTQPMGLDEWREKIDRLERAKQSQDWEAWERIAYGREKESPLDAEHK